MFYLRSFLDHIRVRRSHVKTSQACMSTEVSIHQYVWASVPRNGLFTKVLLKPYHPRFAYKMQILNIWTATGSKLIFYCSTDSQWLYFYTNVWNVTTKPSWMSKHRSEEKRRGNERKNCSFSSPWHAISILYPHLSKSYLKHISFIFLGWMGLKGSPPNTAQWYWGWKERMEMIILPSCLWQRPSHFTAG